MSGEGRHLAALGWEKRLKQGQEAESWGEGVLQVFGEKLVGWAVQEEAGGLEGVM